MKTFEESAAGASSLKVSAIRSSHGKAVFTYNVPSDGADAQVFVVDQIVAHEEVGIH